MYIYLNKNCIYINCIFLQIEYRLNKGHKVDRYFYALAGIYINRTILFVLEECQYVNSFTIQLCVFLCKAWYCYSGQGASRL